MKTKVSLRFWILNYSSTILRGTFMNIKFKNLQLLYVYIHSDNEIYDLRSAIITCGCTRRALRIIAILSESHVRKNSATFCPAEGIKRKCERRLLPIHPIVLYACLHDCKTVLNRSALLDVQCASYSRRSAKRHSLYR